MLPVANVISDEFQAQEIAIGLRLHPQAYENPEQAVMGITTLLPYISANPLYTVIKRLAAIVLAHIDGSINLLQLISPHQTIE